MGIILLNSIKYRIYAIRDLSKSNGTGLNPVTRPDKINISKNRYMDIQLISSKTNRMNVFYYQEAQI
jgi:hypothetical protein